MVGVDVMDVRIPRTQTAAQYFRTMNRQYTPLEWESIQRAADDAAKLVLFYPPSSTLVLLYASSSKLVLLYALCII